jgi:hypothetical protein
MLCNRAPASRTRLGATCARQSRNKSKEPPGTKSPVEILTLKPTVYGVGIDLKELARRVPLLACASARRATMSLLVLVIAPPRVPALAACEGVGMRYLEFFAANIRTRTHAGPMPAPPMNSWPGARASAFRRSVPCNRARRHLDRGWDARDSRRRGQINGSPRSGIC